MASCCGKKKKQKEDSIYVIHQVCHYRQRYDWDCGVSCVMMLLSPDQRQHMLDNFQDICEKEGFGQSTWTIDLCYLLKRFGIKHRMYTTNMGVNEEYRRHGYYSRIIDMDRDRVKQRFEQAAQAGISVRRAGWGGDSVEAHVASRGPAIALVDAGLLACDLCKRNKLGVEFRRCFGGGYRGHYIVVVGVRSSPSGSRLVYIDPACAAPFCACSARRLHCARAAPGTDHDLVLVYKDDDDQRTRNR